MWVRKSNQEMTERDGRMSSWSFVRGPVAVFFLCFVATVGVGNVTPRAQTPQFFGPSSWSEVLSGAAVMATVAAAMTFVLQIILRRPLDPLTMRAKIVMCDSCHRVKHRDSVSKCECGGTFNDLDRWTWVDD